MSLEVDVKHSGSKIAPHSDFRAGAAPILKKFRKRRHGGMKIGAWNVRTLLDRDRIQRPERRSAIVDREIAKYKLDIVALSETRYHGTGQLQEKNYTIFWSGKEQNQPRHNGVAIAICNELAKELKEFPECVSDRLIKLRLPTSSTNYTTIISAYAPTMKAAENSKEAFYELLDKTLDEVPTDDRIILLGDFNARVGSDSEGSGKVTGSHGLGNVNANGRLLMNICAAHGLVITNTFFQCKSKATWIHPRSKHGHLIDYVIVRRKHLHEVLSTKVKRGACCDTDHFLLVSRIIIKPYKPKRSQQTVIPQRLNTGRLNDKKVIATYRAALEQGLNQRETSIINADSNELWNSLKSCIYQAGKHATGVTKKQNADWFDENEAVILPLIEERRMRQNKVYDDPSNLTAKTELRRARNHLQRETRRLKNEWLRSKAEKIQEYADQHDSRKFYQAIKEFYGPTQKHECPVKDKKGSLLKGREEIQGRWNEHFAELLNQSRPVTATALDALPQYPVLEELDQPPTMEELKKALTCMANGKAPGVDGIPTELLKKGGPKLWKELLALMQKIWADESTPVDFKTANIAKIYKKKGDKSDCGNYRGISLLVAAGKLLAKIINIRLLQVVERVTPHSQAGFQRNKGTADMIFALRQLMEKSREQHVDIYIAFIDLEKAFDTVHRETLWSIIQRLGCPKKMTRIIENLHKDNTARVISQYDLGPEFPVTCGVRQGCVLAPTLFIAFVNAVLHIVDSKLTSRSVSIRYRTDRDLFDTCKLKAQTKCRRMFISELQYADDCALVAASPNDLQTTINTFNEAYTALGLKINAGKTKILETRTSQDLFAVSEEAIEKVDHFCYLGSTVTKKLDMEAEIQRRIQSATRAFYKLKSRVFDNRNIWTTTKIAVFKAVILSSLLFASETWTLYRKQIKELEKFQQRQLRRIYRIRWDDFVSNKEVLDRADLLTVETIIERKQLRWVGHIRRMEDTQLPKITLYGELEHGARSSGGQRKRYKDQLHATLKKLKLEGSWDRLAEDRNQWQSIVRNHRGAEPDRRKSSNTTTDPLECDACGRVITSKIGMISHLRTHM